MSFIGSFRLSTACVFHNFRGFSSGVTGESRLDVIPFFQGSMNPYQKMEPFLRHAALHSDKLSLDVRAQLYDFKQKGNKEGYLLFRGFPVDPGLIGTPENVSDVPWKKKTFHSEFWLSCLASYLGEPFGYSQENMGALIHNVRPSRENAQKLSSGSSKQPLGLHSENAFHPFDPDYLILYCLRQDQDKKAETTIASFRRARNYIPRGLEKVLREPLFQTGVDFSFGNIDQEKGNGRIIPILYGDEEDPLITFDPDYMEGLTKEAREAMEVLEAALKKVEKGVLLESGDVLIVDNRRALHGRKEFFAKFDGQDRWLQRMLVSRNLQGAEVMFSEQGRIISHCFEKAIKGGET